MKIDNELKNILVEKAKFYQASAPVYRIKQSTHAQLEEEMLSVILKCFPGRSQKEFRFSLSRTESTSRILLPDGMSADIFHHSGAKIFDAGLNFFDHVINENAEKDERKKLEQQHKKVIEKIGLSVSGDLKFERLWQIKSSGITHDQNQGNTVLNRAVFSYRRFVSGLPVWGAASVYVKVGADFVVDSFGIDLKGVHEDPIDHARILDPEEGAQRVLEELQNSLPGRPFTNKDFEIESFDLGYFSLPKRRYQGILQPTWVAKFISKGFSKMGHVIVIPGANTAYEPINRILAPPPSTKRKYPSYQKCD